MSKVVINGTEYEEPHSSCDYPRSSTGNIDISHRCCSTDSIKVLSEALHLNDKGTSNHHHHRLNDKGVSNNHPRDRELSPSQYSQQYFWDCGLACIQMVVRWVTLFDQNEAVLPMLVTSYLELEFQQQQWMRDFVNTQSIWTIDLFVLLHAIFDPSLPGLMNKNKPPPQVFPSANVHVSMAYCSEYFGVRDYYGSCEYYRDQLEEDAIRVRCLFDMAYKLDWEMVQTFSPLTPIQTISQKKNLCLDIHTLVYFISRPDCVAIALINQYLWTPSIKYSLDESKNPITYTGHYILLVGITYDIHPFQDTKYDGYGLNDSSYPYGLLVRDPSIKENEAQTDIIVSVERFEKCWKSIGTDSDIIFITVDHSCISQSTDM